MLVKKAEPKPEPEAPVESAFEKRATPSETPQAPSGPAAPEAPEYATVLTPVKAETPASVEPSQETSPGSRCPTAAPASAPREDKPARYIQLPPARPASPAPSDRPVLRPRFEPDASLRAPPRGRCPTHRPASGQSPSHVQRSGMPQKEKAVLQMATNTGRGEVRHEPIAPTTPGRRPIFHPPSPRCEPTRASAASRLRMLPLRLRAPRNPPATSSCPRPRPAPAVGLAVRQSSQRPWWSWWQSGSQWSRQSPQWSRWSSRRPWWSSRHGFPPRWSWPRPLHSRHGPHRSQ